MNDNLTNIIYEIIKRKEEGEYWDFKEKYTENRVNFLHDILCLANNLSFKTAYLIYGVRDKDCAIVGVENLKKRKNQIDITNFLRSFNFLGEMPEVKIETIYLEGHELDILVIESTREVPYMLEEKYSSNDRTIYPGVVYTRCFDSNTPINSFASLGSMEKIFKHRFRLDDHAEALLFKFLNDKQSWYDIHSESIDGKYYGLDPNFTIIRKPCSNMLNIPYLYNQVYEVSRFYDIEAKYNNTIIYTWKGVSLNNDKYFTPIPNEVLLDDDVSLYYFIKDETSYVLNLFYYDDTYNTDMEYISRKLLFQNVILFVNDNEAKNFVNYYYQNKNKFTSFINESKVVNENITDIKIHNIKALNMLYKEYKKITS